MSAMGWLCVCVELGVWFSWLGLSLKGPSNLAPVGLCPSVAGGAVLKVLLATLWLGVVLLAVK